MGLKAMLITFLGTRGTIPDAEEGTASILVDNRFLLDVGSEIVSCFERFRSRWKAELKHRLGQRVLSRYGHPTFSKLEYIFITHLHYDHWVGLPHLLHRAQMLEREYRIQRPYQVFVPKEAISRLTTLLESMLGPNVFQFLKIHPVSSGQAISIADDYVVTAMSTKHEVLLPKMTRDEESRITEMNWSNWSSGGALAYRIEQTKEKLDKKKAQDLGINSGRALGILRREGQIEVGEARVSKTDVFKAETTSIVYTGDTPFDPDLLLFCESADMIIHEASYLETSDRYHLDNHSALEVVLTEMEKLYRTSKLIVPIHFSRRYSHEDLQEKFAQLQRNSRHKLLLPRTGLIILLEKQQMQIL
ncbi:MAG: MBL fold metallo-hydrolase [Candidatus Hodarchaeales archaeon]|jgi:ribonuclease Z